MSRHWRPDRSDWTVIDGYGFAERKARGGVVLMVLGAVFLGLVAGAAGLRWNAPVGDSGNFSGPIEWNEVQAPPQRAPDAADVAWQRRAGEREAASGGMTVEGQHIYVIDGDTFSLNGTRIRVAGIDAPETHPARCPYEAQIGAAATQKLADLLRGRPLWVSGLKTDRYGRAVAVVRVNGEDVANAMIGSGLVRNYDGKQRQRWC